MTTFAAKLNRLFEVVHPADRGPYTSSEFCRMVEESGGKLSVPYLSQLRSGRSSRPAYDMVASIAQTFGVRAEYFSDPLYEREVLGDLELTRELGKDPTTWRWDQLHRVTFRHQVLGGDDVPGPVRRLVNGGSHPVAGGTSTVNAMAWTAPEGFGVTNAPSMRMVVDLGDLDASRWVNQTGQSGRPYSPHYTDQAEAWSRGETYLWPFSVEAVQAAKGDELTLEPKK